MSQAKDPEISLVSVVIVTWDSADYLPRCIEKLHEQSWPSWELVVVDNGSVDRSLEIIEDIAPYARVVRNENNLGYSAANNQGIEIARGEYILILNPDILLTPHFIQAMVAAMTRWPDCGMTTGKLYRGWPDPERPEEVLPFDNTGHLIFRNRTIMDRGRWEKDQGQYDREEEVFSGSGAALLLKKAMLQDIRLAEPAEYFDNLFFAYKEEVDLCWRGRLYGWTCVYVPDAIAYHLRGWGGGGGVKHRGQRSKTVPLHLRRHSFKNRYYLLLKNDSIPNLTRDLHLILWYELRALVYLLIREPGVLPAILTVARNMRRILRYRQTIQSHRQVADHDIRRFLV